MESTELISKKSPEETRISLGQMSNINLLWLRDFDRLAIYTRLSQKFCNICIHASFWNKLQELGGRGYQSDATPSISSELCSLGSLLFSDPWLTSCTLNTSITKRRWKLQWRSSSPRRTRTSINVGSKNWQKGGFRQCNMMASTLNAWL